MNALPEQFLSLGEYFKLDETYPDLSVICGEIQLADGRQDTFSNPTVLIEVLSDSTETYDRGKKA